MSGARFRMNLIRRLPIIIGIAYAKFLMPKKVIVGRDVRLSSEGLCNALSEGLMDSGVDVFDIGICGTEMVYFATFNEKNGRRHDTMVFGVRNNE
jgi:phosphomannomutase